MIWLYCNSFIMVKHWFQLIELSVKSTIMSPEFMCGLGCPQLGGWVLSFPKCGKCCETANALGSNILYMRYINVNEIGTNTTNCCFMTFQNANIWISKIQYVVEPHHGIDVRVNSFRNQSYRFVLNCDVHTVILSDTLYWARSRTTHPWVGHLK